MITETEMHAIHLFNVRYYKTWCYLTGWHAIDYYCALEYMEMHNALKDMNS